MVELATNVVIGIVLPLTILALFLINALRWYYFKGVPSSKITKTVESNTDKAIKIVEFSHGGYGILYPNDTYQSVACTGSAYSNRPDSNFIQDYCTFKTLAEAEKKLELKLQPFVKRVVKVVEGGSHECI